MNDDALKRIMQRLYPELTGGLHLPLLARIEKVHKVKSGHKSTEIDPGYCADVQLLDEQGNKDALVPVFPKVPLECSGSGDMRGVFIYPAHGAICELGFFMGQANRPFIKSIITIGSSLPELAPGDAGLYSNSNNYYRINETGDILEQCAQNAERIAQVRQRLKVDDAGKMWIGTESENVLQILSDTLTLIQQLATTCATHIHPHPQGPTQAPTQAGDFSSQSSQANQINQRLTPFTE